MTTALAAAAYLAQHQLEHAGKGWAVFNPHNKPIAELPVIYGFNNGGGGNWWHATLIAQDGTCLGGHVCSHEGYMPADLGVLEGSRPDRHAEFQKHYPDGYRMEFVGYKHVRGHEGLRAAFELNQQKRAEAESKDSTVAENTADAACRCE